MASRESIAPDERLGRLIGETQRLWRACLNRRLRHLGSSQSRWLTLRILSRGSERMSQNELAARIGVEPPTLVAILDSLAREGYIVRRASSRDRRVKTVHLTALGLRRSREIDVIATRLRREIMKELDERSLRAAIGVLEALCNRLSGEKLSPARRR